MDKRRTHTILRKYYKKNKFVTEPEERLLFVLQQHMVIEIDDPMLKHADKHISPIETWEPTHYDIALDKTYAEKIHTSTLQKPFMQFHAQSWRRKQRIPWHVITKDLVRCKLQQKTTSQTITHINNKIQQLGFTPYHPDHSVLASFKVRGYTLRQK